MLLVDGILDLLKASLVLFIYLFKKNKKIKLWPHVKCIFRLSAESYTGDDPLYWFWHASASTFHSQGAAAKRFCHVASGSGLHSFRKEEKGIKEDHQWLRASAPGTLTLQPPKVKRKESTWNRAELDWCPLSHSQLLKSTLVAINLEKLWWCVF